MMKKLLVMLFMTLLVVPIIAQAKNLKRFGDFDKDRDIDLDDFYVFAGKYGTCRGDKSYRGWSDLNKDGCVDRYDFGLFAQHFGEEITLKPFRNYPLYILSLMSAHLPV